MPHRIWKVALAGMFAAVFGGAEGSAAGDVARDSRIQNSLERLPLVFEENRGQALGSISHVARGPGYQIQLAATEAIISVAQAGTAAGASAAAVTRRNVRMYFLGANRRAQVAALEPQSSVSHYFVGAEQADHLTNVPHFARVKFSALYPGIDIVYYGNQSQLEFDFVVQPGADPKKVRMAFEGAERLHLDSNGALVLTTDLGELRLQPPRVYQDIEGGKRSVGARFAISSDIVSLHLDEYDRRYALVIDPTLTYSAGIGGKTSPHSYGLSIAVNAAGEAHVAGWTSASSFSATNGAYDRSIGNSDTDVFVLKLNAAGTALVYATFLGARNDVDYATGIAIDGAGHAYVTGRTSGDGFPTSSTAYQRGVATGGSFIARLNAAGSDLVYSTYLLDATSRAIAVDPGGNAVVAGDAAAGFVTTAGALQEVSANPGGRSAFVLKLNADGSAPVFSTFVGGSGGDQANAVGVDGSGPIYVAGSTASVDFPLQAPFQGVRGGGRDGFVSKLDPTGATLLYSTYLGGSADDWVNAIAIDASGSVYAGGTTGSTNFPVLNAFRSTKGGRISGVVWYNGFVTKLTAAGNALVYSSYLGGDACAVSCSSFGSARGDEVFGIAVNQSGNAFVSGRALSGNFPSIDSFVTPAFSSNSNYPFVAKVAQPGNALLYSTLLSGENVGGVAPDGSAYSAVLALAVDSAGNVYGTGNTKSRQFDNGFPTTVIFGNPYDDVATLFKLSTPPPVTLALVSSAPQAEPGQTVTLTATPRNSDGSIPDGSVGFYRGSALIGSTAIVDGVASMDAALPVGVHPLAAIYRAQGTEGISPLLYQLVNSHAQCSPIP